MDKIKSFVTKHPQWTSWIVLAIGMVAILVWSARDVGLLPGQWAALIIATILVAGLAVWIIGWEDEEEEEEPFEAPRERTPKLRGRRAKAEKEAALPPAAQAVAQVTEQAEAETVSEPATEDSDAS